MGNYHVIGASGYPSLDRIFRLSMPAAVGKTSILQNDDYDTVSYGGCGVNICYVLAKLGARAMPFMNVGEDFSSSGYRAFLQAGQLSLAGVREIPGARTSASILLEDNCGEHATLFYEGAMGDDLVSFDAEEAVAQVDLGILTVGNLKYNTAFLEALTRQGKDVAFSMKFDPHAFPTDALQRFLQQSSYLFMNQREAQSICGLFRYPGVEALFASGRQKCVIVTEGAQGSRIYFRSGERICAHHVPAARARRIVDHAGVGDAFVAGFVYGLTQDYDYIRCARIGSVTASFILEQKGCLNGAPSRADVMSREQESY